MGFTVDNTLNLESNIDLDKGYVGTWKRTIEIRRKTLPYAKVVDGEGYQITKDGTHEMTIKYEVHKDQQSFVDKKAPVLVRVAKGTITDSDYLNKSLYALEQQIIGAQYGAITDDATWLGHPTGPPGLDLGPDPDAPVV